MNTITRLTTLAALASQTMVTGAGEGTSPFIQQAYIKASNSGWNDQFGWSGRDSDPSGGGIALSGDTLVVGAPWEDSSAKGVDGDQGDGLSPPSRSRINEYNSGAAYVFWRYGKGWAQQAYLKSADTAAGDLFGGAVAVSGDTVVVGAPGAGGKQDGVAYYGAAYVFVREGSTWRQQARLNVPGNSEYDHFGVSVAICGDTVVVGASREKSSPAAEGGQAGDLEKIMAGAAYVFVRDGGEWSRQARLVASNPSYANHFGTSVAISEATLIVGAIGDRSAAGGVNGDQTDTSLSSAGAAYVFVRDGTKWSQQAYLKAPQPGKSDQFGSAVTISGDTAVVGAVAAGAERSNHNEDDPGPGAAFLFVRDGDTWSGQASLTPPEFEEGEEFGCSVAICDDRLVVGAKRARDRTNERGNDPGVAYVFTRKAAIWDRGTPIMASNAGHGDQFGGSVAISGGTVAVGAPGEDGFARGVNGRQDENDDDNHDSGAAYVFVISGTDNEGTASAGVGEGNETLEERMFGYWATDWDAMAESWQPLAEELAGLNLSANRGDDEERATAVQSVVDDMKTAFDVQSMEFKRGEMVDYLYPGRPEVKIYRVKSLDEATGALEMEVTNPDQTPYTLRVVLEGDRLTLTEVQEDHGLPMVYHRIDAAAFEERQKAAEERFKD